MNIIDGKEIAKNLRSKIADEVSTFERPPGLAVILVGEDPASAVYVRNKELACKQAGFFSDKIIKSENITEEQLLEEVERLNNNPHIDGILVQQTGRGLAESQQNEIHGGTGRIDIADRTLPELMLMPHAGELASGRLSFASRVNVAGQWCPQINNGYQQDQNTECKNDFALPRCK